MYTERSQYRRALAREELNRNEAAGARIALGEVSEFINEKLDNSGLTGERNIAYREAMRDVTAKILSLLRSYQ